MDWPRVRLREISRPKQWRTIKKSELAEVGYPVYGANGVIGRYHSFNHADPTVLITCRGATCGRINVSVSESWVTGNAMALDGLDTSRVDLRYLVRALEMDGLQDAVTGTAQPQITRQSLERIRVPLPPIGEQRRIAALLDAADALRTKRRQAITRLDSLTQAIFIDMFGDPLSKARHSKMTVLGDLVAFVGGGTPSKAIDEYYDGDICWATSKDMYNSFLDDTQDHITAEAIESSATKLVDPGTVLVVVKSKVLAHRLPVAIARVPTCFGQDLKGLVPNGRVNAEFVATSLRIGQRWLLARTRGVNTEGLTLDELRRFPVADASSEAMEEFRRHSVAVEQQRSAMLTSLVDIDDLFASLQQRAFRGEL